MLHCMTITQLFLQPQLVPHTTHVDVQTFLQSQLVPHTAHSRCSTLSSATACNSHSTQSMLNYFFSLSLYLKQYKSMLNYFFSLSLYLKQYKSMLNCFFSLSLHLTSTSRCSTFSTASACTSQVQVDAQLFLQPQLVPHTAHSRFSFSFYLTEHTVKSKSFFSLGFALLFFRP